MRIEAPSANESDFVNRKGFHSINVQAVCNHKGRYSKCDKRLLFMFGFKCQKPGILQHCGKISRENGKAIHLKKILYSCCKHFQESGIAEKVSVSIKGVHP